MAAVAGDRAAAAPAAGDVIYHGKIRLIPITAFSRAAVDQLMIRLALTPAMASPGFHGMPPGSRFGEACVMTEVETGQTLGILSNVEIADYPGVAGFIIYVDRERARPGHAMLAASLYAQRMFDLGARKIQMEVLSFNSQVHSLMRKIGARAEAVLRDHYYIGGRYWDATLYGLGVEEWKTGATRKYRIAVRRSVSLSGLPDRSRATRHNREDTLMRVDYLILADAAIAVDGKHYLHGAGWETIFSATFPAEHSQLTAALRVRVPARGFAQPHRVGIDVVDAEGTSVLSTRPFSDVNDGTPPPVSGNDDQLLCVVVNLQGVRFASPGTYAVVVTIDGVEAHRTQLNVRQTPAPTG